MFSRGWDGRWKLGARLEAEITASHGQGTALVLHGMYEQRVPTTVGDKVGGGEDVGGGGASAEWMDWTRVPVAARWRSAGTGLGRHPCRPIDCCCMTAAGWPVAAQAWWPKSQPVACRRSEARAITSGAAGRDATSPGR